MHLGKKYKKNNIEHDENSFVGKMVAQVLEKKTQLLQSCKQKSKSVAEQSGQNFKRKSKVKQNVCKKVHITLCWF